MDPRKSLGQHRVAEIRNDDHAVALAAEVTSRRVDEVKTLLQGVHGAALVRTALADVWPWQATKLGSKTAALAREAGLQKEILWLTRTSKTLVTRRLNSASGKKLLKNLFWDSWPADDAGISPPPEEVAPPEAHGDTRAAEGLAPPETSGASSTEPPPAGIVAGALMSSRYDLLRELGAGGFGTSWLAHDRLSGLEVVLKFPHEDDGGAIRRELELAFQVVHPNICQAFPDRDDETGQPFLVMQYGGKDLRALLEERQWKPFPLPLAIHVLLSVATAMDYLHHERHLLHLDVSPMNILMGEDDVVRLTDFGASARARLTPTGTGSHTVAAGAITSLHHFWSAPELFQGIGRGRSDQYSLFLVFASLLTGRMPRAHGDLPRPPFSVLTPKQNAAVQKALSFDPDARFESCGEAARTVAEDIGHLPPSGLEVDLDTLSRELELRLERELQRVTKTSTSQVGGVVKIGRALERLLEAALLWQAVTDGFDPNAALRTLYPSVGSTGKATAGQLANTIRKSATGRADQSPQIARLVADLDSQQSRLWRLINARNDVVHGVRPGDSVIPIARTVGELIAEYRRAAGWT